MKLFAIIRIIKLFLQLELLIFVSCKEDTPNQPTTSSEKPVVNIITPLNNSEVLGIVPIIVEATDNKGIIKVEIFIDDSLRVTLITPPYEYTWNTFNDIDSTLHIIFAKAYDADDNVSSSQVNNVIVKNFRIFYSIINDELIELKWVIAEPNNFRFIIEESVNNKNYVQILETEKGVTSKILNRIYSTDSVYKYRITPKTDSLLYFFLRDSIFFSIEIPPPVNINYEVLSENSLKLTWFDNCDYETGYRIERRQTNGAFEFLAELSANSTDYIDNSFNINSTSSYSIATFTNNNESNPTITNLIFPPIISNEVIEPDTFEVTSTDTIFVSISVFDQNGLSDIAAVYFNMYLGTILLTSEPTNLYDDGNIQTNGDLIAGDGIFSRLIAVGESSAVGITFRFEFQAMDFSGLLSNIINHYVVIL